MASGSHGTCVFVDIDDEIAIDLRSALIALGWSVGSRLVPDYVADVVFCGVESVVRTAAGQQRELPVVGVGREPTEQAWIAALEAGAADYLCAGFETVELRWILQSVMGPREVEGVGLRAGVDVRGDLHGLQVNHGHHAIAGE